MTLNSGTGTRSTSAQLQKRYFPPHSDACRRRRIEQPRQVTDPGRRTVELWAVASPKPRNSEDGVRSCICFSSASSSSNLKPPLCGYAKCHVTLIVAPTGSVVMMSLLGIPQGPLVRPLSRKSRSYRLAGGKVSATCPRHGGSTRAAAKAAAITNVGPRMTAANRSTETTSRRCGFQPCLSHFQRTAAVAADGRRPQAVDALLDHSGRWRADRHGAETLLPGGHGEPHSLR